MLGPRGSGRRTVRPYAKYDSAPDGSILMTFSDGHPGSYENNLYYMRFKDGRFYKADGSVIGTTRDLPFRLSQLDMVQRYSEAKGRPWPMDIAWNSDGVPSIVYSSRVGYDDVFRYARWNGTRWVTRLVSPAGGSLFGYRNGGITFNHADPRWVVLTRLIDGRQEIEVRYTPDQGRPGSCSSSRATPPCSTSGRSSRAGSPIPTGSWWSTCRARPPASAATGPW